MQRSRVHLVTLSCIIFLMTVACTPTRTPSPIPTEAVAVETEATATEIKAPRTLSTEIPSSATPVRTVRPTSNLSPPRNTLEPSSVPIIEETPPPAPLSTIGPWLAFLIEEPGEFSFVFSIFAVNADGSGMTQVVEPFTQIHTYRPILRAAPRGGRISFIVEPEELKPELRVFSFDSGRVSTVASLISDAIDPLAFDAQEFEQVFLQIYAAVVLAPGRWAPDGRSLAFVGAMAADNSDLFLYSFEDGSIVRLTDGPTETVYLNWSPDGEYILHGAVGTLYSGASGNQYDLRGIYAARADGAGVHQVYPLEVTGHERFPGWVNETQFLVDRWQWYEGYSNLRLVDLLDGSTQQLYDGIYQERAFDPQNRVVLISILGPDPGGNTCSNDEPGYVLVPVDGGPLQHLSVHGACTQGELIWSVAAGVFFADTEDGPVIIHPNGQVTELSVDSIASLAVAPDGDRWVVTERGLWLEEMGGESRLIFDRHAESPVWSSDGTRVFFFGPTLAPGFEGSPALYMASAPDYVPQLLAAGFHDFPDPYSSSVVWVEP